MPKGRIGLSLSEDVMEILNRYGRTGDSTNGQPNTRPTRTEIIETAVRLWAGTLEGAAKLRALATARKIVDGNVKSEPSQHKKVVPYRVTRAGDTVCGGCGLKVIDYCSDCDPGYPTRQLKIAGQLDPEVAAHGQEDARKDMCADGHAWDAGSEYCHCGAVIDPEPQRRATTDRASKDEEVPDYVAVYDEIQERLAKDARKERKGARVTRKAKLGESVKGALPERVPLSLIGDPVEREKRIREMAEAEKANPQPLARRTVTPLPKPSKKGSK